jgi:G3E family GTPase
MKLILVGGFLGSGKTTAIVSAARVLMNVNKKVAVITNDQGDQQVDASFVKSFGITTREVSKGCFCCNYQQLDDHLSALQENNPDIIFAESVGSCTDLIATIAKPLFQFKPEIETVISIFADAELLMSVIEGRSSFTDSVRYIYKKQLEEADILILNKVDLIDTRQLTTLDHVIKSEYPGKIILHQRSLETEDIERWLDCLEQFTNSNPRKSLDIEYDEYGSGEAMLAWLDKDIIIRTSQGEALFIAGKIMGSIADQLQSRHLAIGHLKFFVDTGKRKVKISFTATSTSVDLKIQMHETNCVRLLINARVETAPGILKTLVDDVLSNASKVYKCHLDMGKWSVFKPGYPRPTNRVL